MLQFINLASGSRFPVSNNLRSCTQEVHVAPDFILDGHKVTLIDTPGFDVTDKSVTELVQIIVSFLETQCVSLVSTERSTRHEVLSTVTEVEGYCMG